MTPEAAKLLLNTPDYSPTRLDGAFSCPLMYFFKYGLKIREPLNNDLEAPNNTGTAIHDILRTALSNCPQIAEKTEEEIDVIAEKAVSDSMNRSIAEDPTFPEKTEAIYKRFIGRVKGILKQISLEYKLSGFTPLEYEREVSYVIKNPDFPDGKITIKGTADRIDALDVPKSDNTGFERYIRICDYKSSPKKFTLDGVVSGKNLQPLLYLFGKCVEEKDCVPGSVNYSTVGG